MKETIKTFARHPVLSNLIMIGVLAAGVVSTKRMNTELFPEFDLDIVTVRVIYPQASPPEVEEGIVMRIEDAIQGITGIKRVMAMAAEGVGTVTIELESGADTRRTQDDIRNAIDAIDTFPADAERPIIRLVTMDFEVIRLAVYGDAPERTLKEAAQDIRDELLIFHNVAKIDLLGVRDYQIAIEVSEEALRRYGLTFQQVEATVRASSLNVPGGTLWGDDAERKITIEGRRYTAAQYADILLIATPGGARIRLGDVATVRDTFEEGERIVRFNGLPAVVLNIRKSADQDAIAMSERVTRYALEKQAGLPEGIRLTPWADWSKFIQDRLSLLFNNGLIGMALVALSLWMFMNGRMAFWVAMGIPVSFAGGLILLYTMGQTMNMMSMFALIMATGLIVDDAIIVGENVHRFIRSGHSPRQAAIKGTLQVAFPVVVTVTTTVVAFSPLLLIPGAYGKFMEVLPLTLIAVLAASLLEVFFILPAHLSHSKPAPGDGTTWPARLRRRMDAAIEWSVQRVYRPFFYKALRYRAMTFAVAASLLIVCMGLWGGGVIRWEVFPDVDSDVIVAEVTFPHGTPASVTTSAVQRLEAAAFKLTGEFAGRFEGESLLVNMSSSIGELAQLQPDVESQTGVGRHAGSVLLELAPAERRPRLTSMEIIARWRELTGPISGVTALNYDSMQGGGPAGPPIEIRLGGDDVGRMREGAAWVRDRLATYPGVTDIADDFRYGPPEIQITRLKPAGESLGLTIEDVGLQLMHGFFGAEPVRIQRGRDDVKVKVRYPIGQRRSPADIEAIRIRAPGGAEVPIRQVAELDTVLEPAVIQRRDRMRVITVEADVDTDIANAAEVLAAFRQRDAPELMREYPGLWLSYEGQQQEAEEALSSLLITFPLALMVMYLLLAAQFGSYFQPVIIMLAIPFGIVGAALAHLVAGLPLTLLSVFGIVAVSGVVVNDALVLVEFVHIGMREGKSVFQAVFDAGPARFRPILLTTMTTVAGLLPLIVERSMQAQILIPMAVSICGGLIVATFLNLLVTPSLYLMTNDARRIGHWMRRGAWPSREEVEPEMNRLRLESETA